MLWRPDETAVDRDGRLGVVVAGPGSALTIPGIVVSEIVRALGRCGPVTRVEVDVASDFMAGLHRAPSLSSTYDEQLEHGVVLRRAPKGAHQRTQIFRDILRPDIRSAIAYAWPGIDNGWIRHFLQVARATGVPSAVLCASLPVEGTAPLAAMAGTLALADRVFVGERADANELASIFGSFGPVVEVHESLSLRGRAPRSPERQITAFLPKDNEKSLATLLSAFDAIPEAWISNYQLRIIMRYTNEALPAMVADSYHAEHVLLIGDDIPHCDLEYLCTTSSALGIADPNARSRALATAMDAGIATVVLATAPLPGVGRGYAGGLLADLRQPASVHVALNHALRLEDLRFPKPGSWDRLARRLSPTPRFSSPLTLPEPAATDL